MFIKSILKNPKGISYEGEDKDEKILYVFRQSLLTNIPWLFITFIMLVSPLFLVSMLPSFISYELKFLLVVFWYLVTFGYTFQRVLNWFFNVYIISNKKILDVDFHGFLYKNISEAPLKSIEDVTSNVKGALGVIFNIGDVYIQTAAEKREFEFTKLDDPSHVRDLVSDLVARKRGHSK